MNRKFRKAVKYSSFPEAEFRAELCAAAFYWRP
jgi:hypothetical protein